MKTILILSLIFAIVFADNFPLDLTAGDRYIATGTLTSYSVLADFPNVPFGPSTTVPSTWVSDPPNNQYYHDIGPGGTFWYLPNATYVKRDGKCFNVAGYNSSVLLATYSRTKSFTIDNRPDNRTFFGNHASTCGTSLSQLFVMSRQSIIEEWIFNQKTSLFYQPGENDFFPAGINVCLQVQGHFKYNDIERYKNPNVVMPFPPLDPQCSTIDGEYCTRYYYAPGQVCNYETYTRP